MIKCKRHGWVLGNICKKCSATGAGLSTATPPHTDLGDVLMTAVILDAVTTHHGIERDISPVSPEAPLYEGGSSGGGGADRGFDSSDSGSSSYESSSSDCGSSCSSGGD